MNGVDTTRSDGTTRCVQIACAVSNNDNTRTALSACAACFTRTSATTTCIGAARSTISRIIGRTFTTTTRATITRRRISKSTTAAATIICAGTRDVVR